MTALNAQAATIANLRAEVASLAHDNAMLAAQMVIDAARIKRLLASVPVPPWSAA